MKLSSVLLGGSLVANLALLVVLLLPPSSAPDAADASRAANGGSKTEAVAANVTGANKPDPAPNAKGAAANRTTWDQLRSDDLAALVPKLQEAGFPPQVIRRIIVTLVAERFDARRLEIEKDNLAAPFWKNAATGYNDPKVGAELIKLQREQIDTIKKILGGTVGDVLADNEENKAMLKLQIGNIAPEKIDQLYATAMEYGLKRQQIAAQRGNSGPMLPADLEKLAAADIEYRGALAKFLTPEETNEFLLRQSETSGRMRNMLGPAQPTEAEFRAIFPLYQDYLTRFPQQLIGTESPEQAAARRTAEADMLAQLRAAVGNDRAADFVQAANPQSFQLNRLVARLDLPISAAAQVVAVQNDVQRRVTELRNDSTLDGAARVGQLSVIAQDAQTRITQILGPRGVQAYQQNGGQWLTNLTPRPPQTPKN